MRARPITWLLAAGVAMAHPATAQEEEVFIDSFEGAPELQGRIDNGLVVLDDRSYCAYVLGGAFGSGRHISVDVLEAELEDEGFNRRSVSRAIRDHARQAVTDDLLLDACAHRLRQFRHPNVSFFEILYPGDPDVAESAPDPPWWQAMPVLPASVMEFLDERAAR